jgi:predicted CopG family antitoxin
MSTKAKTTTIRITRETYEDLSEYGRFHESFDSVIKKLLSEKQGTETAR